MHAYSYLCTQMKDSVSQQLFRKLKKENCFWSYDMSKMKSISDEALIEHVLLYLDIDDINKLFPLLGCKRVKRVWLDHVAPQGEMFRTINILYAWYYIGAKRPEGKRQKGNGYSLEDGFKYGIYIERDEI